MISVFDLCDLSTHFRQGCFAGIGTILTLWHGNLTRVTDPLWGESTGPKVAGIHRPLFVFFGLSIVSCSLTKSLILGCLWPLVLVLNNTLIPGIWCSTIPHLPGCFCPWTFFENIGFNTMLTDPFMSHLATQLAYSAGEFQSLQLIVLAAFGVVD